MLGVGDLQKSFKSFALMKGGSSIKRMRMVGGMGRTAFYLKVSPIRVLGCNSLMSVDRI